MNETHLFPPLIQFLEFFIQFIKVAIWPLVTIYAIRVFKPDLKKALMRLKKATFLGGNEVEFSDEVEELNENVKRGREEVSDTVFSMEENEEKSIQLNQDMNEIFEAARINPEIGIMKLSSILEREVRTLAVRFLGQQHPNLKMSFLKLCQILISENYLPPHIAQSLKVFSELRNKIVHGNISKGDENVIKVLDIGLSLLETITSVPMPG